MSRSGCRTGPPVYERFHAFLVMTRDLVELESTDRRPAALNFSQLQDDSGTGQWSHSLPGCGRSGNFIQLGEARPLSHLSSSLIGRLHACVFVALCSASKSNSSRDISGGDQPPLDQPPPCRVDSTFDLVDVYHTTLDGQTSLSSFT